MFGGLLVGFGIVFLTVPAATAPAASNGRGDGRILGGNDAEKSPLRVNGHLSINRALHKLAG